MDDLKARTSALKDYQVPLITVARSDLAQLVRICALFGGTIVYSSAPDIEDQIKFSMTDSELLMVVIDAVPDSNIVALLQSCVEAHEARPAIGAARAVGEHRLALVGDIDTLAPFGAPFEVICRKLEVVPSATRPQPKIQ